MFICLYVYMFICLYVYMFICLYVYMFICLYGDWGLGIGDWAQSPIPNPQSPLFS